LLRGEKENSAAIQGLKCPLEERGEAGKHSSPPAAMREKKAARVRDGVLGRGRIRPAFGGRGDGFILALASTQV